MKQTKTLWIAMAFAFAIAVSLLSSPASGNAQERGTSVQAQAQTSSWTGQIEEKDLNGVKTYVFTVGGQTYPVEPQEKASEFVGKTVKITGKMEGNKVVISEIEEV